MFYLFLESQQSGMESRARVAWMSEEVDEGMMDGWRMNAWTDAWKDG